ncbi:hypothetical protein [Acinetobacter sp. Marseille-Q1623]|uniref:hypothetical protein n=1 Tax=Acinetobacter sp. Marseille-Q1623 TaxID=2697501 RepID=UPI00157A6545|nr:hypothetical protein [Acinetobacter sp. Marseille-Q1623]
MACIIQGQIDRVKLQDIIQPILLPLNIKVIEDCSEMAEPNYLNFDSHFEVCYLSNHTLMGNAPNYVGRKPSFL